MKKRLLLIVMLLVMTPLVVLTLKYALTVALQPALRPQPLAALVPADPLVYVECPQLKTRLAQLIARPEYQTFLQSEFFEQVQQTEWWRDAAAAFEEFWRSLMIDPLRIIGADVAVAVYPAEKGATVPGVMLIGKIDRTAKIAERLLYVVDRVNNQVGITFEQNYQGFPIYAIAQPEMLCPLYYTIAGDLGLIATSLALLQAALRAAVGAAAPPAKPSAFNQTMPALPENRMAAGYFDFSRIAAEFRQNPWLQSLEIPWGSIWEDAGDWPFVTLGLDARPDRVALRLELCADADIAKQPDRRSPNPAPAVSLPADVPLAAALDQQKLTPFLLNGQRIFPQRDWSAPVQALAETQAIFGGRLECRVAGNLAGAVYLLPELACLLETQRPAQARELLDAAVRSVLTQRLPAIAQQTLVRRVTETYRNGELATVQFMFQEMFAYLVTEGGQQAYTVLATTAGAVKKRLETLPTRPDERPYALTLPDEAAFAILLRNPGLADLLRKFSQTNTFALLYPPQTFPQFEQSLPLLIRFLQPLPPLLLAGGAQGTGLYLELGLVEK